MAKKSKITAPPGIRTLLLHCCCAPCSTAIVEWMGAHGLTPVLFFYNPNIYPQAEYEIRKTECQRHAQSLGLRFLDGDADHAAWRAAVQGLETAPERGPRCQKCFDLRLQATALQARDLGLEVFATTLASSRWKSLEQVHSAGAAAQAAVPGTRYWAQNWRIEGLVERRAALIKAYGFYQQQYCGCEFSLRLRQGPPLP